ncbi:MAG: hypothetical protein IPK90_08105 [Chitinophagaceae bacterium]|nr:hypothetical protein [Chitinophagaceae bacterium]
MMLKRPVRILEVSTNINYPKEVHIGNNMYLVERGFSGIHKKTIYSAQFQRARDFDKIEFISNIRGALT